MNANAENAQPWKPAAHLPYSAWIHVALYLVLFVWIYKPAYQLMFAWWQREDFNYCYLVPLIVAYLIWEKRHHLLQTPSAPSWIGMLPLFAGVFLFWLGELGGEYYTLYLSSWFVFVGLCWAHMGWRKLKIILFPVVFALTMFPPPNFVFNNISMRMKLVSSKLGVDMMQAYGMSAFREGNIIDLGFTQLQVVDACSGLRYLIPLIVLGLLLAYFFKAHIWKRIFLVVSCVPISIVVNSLRIASVGVLYQFWGAKVAEGFFHDFSGWLIFMVSLAILLVEMWILKKLPPRQRSESVPSSQAGGAEESKPNPGKPSRGGLLRPPQFVVALLLLLATAGLSHGIEFREKVPITKPLHQFPMTIGHWSGQKNEMDQAIINTLDLSDYLLADYQNGDRQMINFYVAYYESQAKGDSIHSPASCLPGSGWTFDASGTAILAVPGSGESTITVKRAVMRKGNFRQLSYFWFPARGRVLTDLFQLKLFTFWDALTRQRTDGGLVRLITPVYTGEDVREAEGRLKEFTKAVIPVLDQYLPN